MPADTNLDISGASKLMRFWPMLLALVGVIGFAARADSSQHEISSRVDYLYTQGSPALTQRLARIEQHQLDDEKARVEMKGQLDRIETELQDLSK